MHKTVCHRSMQIAFLPLSHMWLMTRYRQPCRNSADNNGNLVMPSQSAHGVLLARRGHKEAQ